MVTKSTQKSIARKLGLSDMTVSRVINNHPYVNPDTRKKVLALIRKENYYPHLIAKALRTNKISSIGIIMRSGGNVFAVPYFIELLKGIEEVCIDRDYDIVLSPTGHKEFQYQKIIHQRKADGYIIVAPEIGDKQLMVLKKADIPFVVINNFGSYNYIDADNFQGAYDLCKYLIESGHRRIAFINGFMNMRNSVQRFSGYRKALEDFHLEYIPELVFEGRYDLDSGEETAEKIIAMKKRPDAVFAANDLMAIGLMKKLQEQGIAVPGAISVAGFDNIELSNYVNPALTTVDQQVYLLGKNAALNIFKLINNEQDKYQEVLPVKVILRKSCKDRRK